jgi:hypothetical protein
MNDIHELVVFVVFAYEVDMFQLSLSMPERWHNRQRPRKILFR